MIRRYGLALLALAMAGAAQAQPIATAPPPRSADAVRGKALFERTCAYCHRQRGFGSEAMARRLGPPKALLEQRADLREAYIRYVVHHGLGNMPAYTPTDLSDAELGSIVAYLTHKP